MCEPKYTEWILETIDQLRKRKARPDRDRICHMVERKHGVTFEETEADLERLIDSEIILKVDYKGSTSYRNAAKWKKSHLGGNVLNSKEATQSIRCAVRELSSAVSESASAKGASLRDIENWIEAQGNCPSLVKNHLLVAITRETDAGRLKRLQNGNYVVAETKKSGNVSGKNNAKGKSAIHHNKVRLQTLKYKSVAHGKKARPIPCSRVKLGQKIKKANHTIVKKKHRELVYEADEEPKPPMPNIFRMEEKCDYCLLTEECNRHGEEEDLLVCKDCNAKAHPSCMDYSAELAMRARSSPWQCMDCKTCYLCQDSGDAADMLFCDACDKGYHMKCHKPQISTKPTGKWVCNRCVLEGCTVGDEAMDQSSRLGAPVNADGLLSTLDSPVDFDEGSQVKEEQMDSSDTADMDTGGGELIKPLPVNPSVSARGEPDTAEWSIEKVEEYLEAEGFKDQAENFKEQEIDGKSMMLLKRGDVLTGLSLKLGPALKVYQLVQRLQTEAGMNV